MTWIEPAEFPGAPALDAAGVAAHYDREDVLFRALWGDHLHHGVRARGGHSARAVAAVERVARLLRVEPGLRVLDVGCGYGGPAVHLAKAYGARMTGITLSRPQFQRANQLAAELTKPQRPRWILGDWLEQDLESESFDAALSVECFGHVVNKRGFLEKLRDVLVPGGRMALVFWAAAGSPNTKQRGQLEVLCREARLPSLGSESAVRELAEQAGFRWAKSEDWSRDVLGTWPRAVAQSAWLTARRADVRARVLGRDGASRVPAGMALRMIRTLRSGTLRYVAASLERE